MRTFPGAEAAWSGEQELKAGVAGERWHVYVVLDGLSRRLDKWMDRLQRIALESLAPTADDVLSMVAPEDRHITCHMISLPAPGISAQQIEEFAADLRARLALVEPIFLRMRQPVAGAYGLEGDVFDPHPRQPWQAISDVIGTAILVHFGPEARRHSPPAPHASVGYGAPGPGGDSALLFDSGTLQSALCRRMRAGEVEFRVAEFQLIRVRQDPKTSTYRLDRAGAIRLPLGVGVPEAGAKAVAAWLAGDPQAALDSYRVAAIGEVEVPEACLAAVIGADDLPGARARIAALVDTGVVAVRAGRYRLIDDPRPDAVREIGHARGRLLSWYLHAALQALHATGDDSLVFPVADRCCTGPVWQAPAGFEEGRDWFVAEHEALAGVLVLALAARLDEQCWQLAAAWCGYLAAGSELVCWGVAVEVGLAAAERLEDRFGCAVLGEYRGKLLTQSGHLERGELEARAALELREQIGDVFGVMRSINALGLTHLRAGQFDEARTSFTRAKAMADESGALDFRVAARVNVGIVLVRAGEYDPAREELEAAIGLADPHRHLALLANALQELAGAYARLGRPVQALESARSAVNLAQQAGLWQHKALSLMVLAEIYSAAGEHVKALDAARAACSAIRRPGDPQRIRAIFARAAHVAEAAGEIVLAPTLTNASNTG